MQWMWKVIREDNEQFEKHKRWNNLSVMIAGFSSFESVKYAHRDSCDPWRNYIFTKMWKYSKCQPCCCCKLVLRQTCLLQSHTTTWCRSIPLEELVAFDESPSWRSSEEKTKNRLLQQKNEDTKKKSPVLRSCEPSLACVLCRCPLNMSNWNWKNAIFQDLEKLVSDQKPVVNKTVSAAVLFPWLFICPTRACCKMRYKNWTHI